jgi:DNA-directed RNA polymerase specialized sigma24 family protein
MEDSDVVGSIVAGDPHGLDDAFDRHADPLYKYCRTLLRDPSDAADEGLRQVAETAARRWAAVRLTAPAPPLAEVGLPTMTSVSPAIKHKRDSGGR